MDDSSSSLVQLFLVNSAIFTAPALGSDWPAYISYFPDPENVNIDTAVISDIAPSLDGRWMVDGSVVQHRGVSIRTRSSDYLTGWQKNMDVLILLSETFRQNITKNGSTYIIDSFSTPSGIIYLGVDEGTKRRYNFEIKYDVAIRQTS
jgi:hypothetical protein